MQVRHTKVMEKQSFYPGGAGSRDVTYLSRLGIDHPDGISYGRGKDWYRAHTCRQDTFSLVAVESHHAGTDCIGYTKQEDYIKINFWLSGRHSTILEGFGQHDHDRPEVFITSGPWEMTKIDV